MDKLLFYLGMGFGVLLFILGFWTLKPTIFGYESVTMTFGMLVMFAAYITYSVQNTDFGKR